MLSCKKCGKSNYVKSGLMNGKQRYKCKECGCKFTNTPPRGEPIENKILALKLYLEGMGFRQIGRIIGVSNVAILKWIRNFGEITKQIHEYFRGKVKPTKVIELDEMWSFVKKNKTKHGYGLHLIEKDENGLIVVYKIVDGKHKKTCGIK